jgi:hypothetical protein
VKGASLTLEAYKSRGRYRYSEEVYIYGCVWYIDPLIYIQIYSSIFYSGSDSLRATPSRHDGVALQHRKGAV